MGLRPSHGPPSWARTSAAAISPPQTTNFCAASHFTRRLPDGNQRIIYVPSGGHASTASNVLTGNLIKSFGDNGIVDMHDDLDWTPPRNKLLNLESVHVFSRFDHQPRHHFLGT